MSGILGVTSVFFLYQLWQSYKNKRAYKTGGTVKNTYTQKSFLTKVMGIILLLSVSFTIGTYNAFGNMAFVNLPLIAYFILMLYNHTRNIEVLEKGLFLNGRFIEWAHIDKVEVEENATLRLFLNGERYKIYVIDKVDQIGLLQNAIRLEIKKAKKLAK